MAIDYSKQLRPRRGKASTMKTAEKKAIVLAAGELFIEYPNTGLGTGAIKVKIGDGVTDYEHLAYAISNDASTSTVIYVDNTSTTVEDALANIISGASLNAIVPALKQAVTLLNGEAIKGVTLDNVAGTITNNNVSISSPDYTIAPTTASGGEIDITLSPSTGRGKSDSSFGVVSTNGTITIGITSGSLDIEANATGAISSVYTDDLTASKALVSTSAGKIAASSVSTTELGYLSGTTASVQTQLNSMQPAITGAASTIVSDDLTASKALVSTSAGKVGVSSVSTTELGYLSGTTASVQTQLNGKSDTTHNHNLDDLNGTLTVTKLSGGATSAKIDIDLIPHGAIENLYIATDETAIRALTSDDVQNGDVVKNQETGVMYYVAHDDQLPIGSTAPLTTAFEPFVAGSVDWSAVTNKPSTFPPSTHTHTMSQITDLYSTFTGASSSAAGTVGFVPAPAAGDQNKYLAGNGQWVAFVTATSSRNGLMSSTDKTNLDDMTTYFASTSAFDFGDEG